MTSLKTMYPTVLCHAVTWFLCSVLLLWPSLCGCCHDLWPLWRNICLTETDILLLQIYWCDWCFTNEQLQKVAYSPRVTLKRDIEGYFCLVSTDWYQKLFPLLLCLDFTFKPKLGFCSCWPHNLIHQLVWVWYEGVLDLWFQWLMLQVRSHINFCLYGYSELIRRG